MLPLNHLIICFAEDHFVFTECANLSNPTGTGICRQKCHLHSAIPLSITSNPTGERLGPIGHLLSKRGDISG